MAAQKWVLVIDGDSAGAQGAVEGVSAKTIAMGNIMSDIAKGAAQALAGAFSSLVGELGKSVSMAAEAQKNQMTLASAMQQAGTYTREAFEASLEYASSLQKITTYGDDEINVVQRLLTNFGLEGEALNAATKATLDLATAKTMDLASAGDIVAKSIGTETNALKRYGVEADAAAGSTERVAQVVEGITSLFGGSAQAQTLTFSGRLKQLSEVYGDLYEEVGSVITNNKGLQEVFTILKTIIEDATKWVGSHKEALANLIKDGIVLVIQSLGLLVGAISWVSSAWTDAGNALLKVSEYYAKFVQTFYAIPALVSKSAQSYVDFAKSIENASKEEASAGTEAAKKRAAFLEDIQIKIDAIAAKIGLVSTAFQPLNEAIETTGTNQKNLVDKTGETYDQLIDLARGWTDAELLQYENRQWKMQEMVEKGMMTEEEYTNWRIANGKKFDETESKQMEQRKANVQATNNAIISISNAAAASVLSGQKNLGLAMEDAAKASARAIIDVEIDKAIQSIGITEALEAGKAAMGGFLSFGATLLLIPLIAAASAAAKAIIHGVVGFSGGGIVGEGGSKLPLTSFASSGAGAPALVMAHVGEAIGTPGTLAAAGVGGMTVNVNIMGGISSELDADIIGERIGQAVQNKMRGTI